MKIRLISRLLALSALSVCAFAQDRVDAVLADRSVPFGVQAGQLVMIDGDVLFVAQADPQQTFAIRPSNISAVNVAGDVLTIRTDSPAAGSTEHSFRVADAAAAAFGARIRSDAHSAATAPPPSSEDFRLAFDVEEQRTFSGDENGKLTIGEEEVRYTSVTDADRSFAWQYQDIKEFIRKAPNKIKIKSFEGDDYTFTLIGKGLSSGDYREITDRLARARTGD